MNIVSADGGEQELLQDIVKYVIKGAQYADKQRGNIKRITANSPQVYFLNISDERIQVKMIQKSMIEQLSRQQILTLPEILKQSKDVQWYQFDQISKLDKKTMPFMNELHYLIAFYSPSSIENNKFFVIYRLPDEYIWNQFFDIANKKIMEQREYVKKSITNFLPIEENIRKIIEKILACSHAKSYVYDQIRIKLDEKRITLSVKQTKILVYALMGNHPEMQNVLRKQKIQSYDIQKRKHDDTLKQQLSANIVEIIQPNKDVLMEGYSEKRKLDGIIQKRINQKVEKDPLNNNRIQQELYLNKIPTRSDMEIDQLIGIRKQFQRMQIQPEIKQTLPLVYKCSLLKVPIHDYSITNRQRSALTQKAPPTTQVLDKNHYIIIQIIKFMYQLMKVNNQQRNTRGSNEGPMDKILECLKDILTEQTKRPSNNNNIKDLVTSGTKNYLQYRKNPMKFY